jgi:hypothetical protein
MTMVWVEACMELVDDAEHINGAKLDKGTKIIYA